MRDALSGRTDIRVVEADPYSSAARLFRPTAIVCAPETPDEVDALLYEHVRARVVTVEDDGRRGSLHELVPRVRDLGELSPESVRAAVRGVPE